MSPCSLACPSSFALTRPSCNLYRLGNNPGRNPDHNHVCSDSPWMLSRRLHRGRRIEKVHDGLEIAPCNQAEVRCLQVQGGRDQFAPPLPLTELFCNLYLALLGLETSAYLKEPPHLPKRSSQTRQKSMAISRFSRRA